MKPASPMRIVLLEDDADSRAAIAALFGLEGIDVHEAHDAESFRQVTRNLDIQTVIFDLHLGDGSFGPALAADYQAQLLASQKPSAKLIALSGSSPQLLAQPMPCRVHHRLHKPVDFNVLLRSVHD